MVTKLLGGVLGVLILAATAAQASEATTVADRAGFLVGHAQRCGVAEARLERSTKRISAVIAAFADDDQDREAAETRFGDSMIAAAFAKLLGDPLPSCATVRSALAQFERHRQPAKEGQTAQNVRRDSGLARHAASAHKAPSSLARRSSGKREDLSAERRDTPGLLRAAQHTRAPSN